jgi:energy-coupling factor transporter ATP-binding protein EcfA2
MKNRLQSIRLQRFKRITDVSFDLRGMNVLVGSNNSGKSSVIEGLHFGVALLQTIGIAGRWPPTGDSHRTSLTPNQLIYSPSEEVYALAPGGRLLGAINQAITLDLNLATGESCSLSIQKGKNQNIVVSISGVSAAKRLSTLNKPFSIFSPGLAGIAKREHHVSDGVLLRTLARGDANLVLRNILLRLWDSVAIDAFLGDMHSMFPDVQLDVVFTSATDEFVNVKIKSEGHWVPLELAGTGILQAIQILSYIHLFEPSIVVLDEPDSHLHPNNQRLLCSLLRRVAEERGTQVLLTTHSRHVVDALGSATAILWVRNGQVDIADPDDEIGILLELGALDVKERASHESTRAIVLTEDEDIRALRLILSSSGFKLDETAILPYYGITAPRQLAPLLKAIRGSNSAARIVVHRDRDFLTESEVEAWKTEIRSLGVEAFVTKGIDIESYFIKPEHLAEANDDVSIEDIKATLDAVAEQEREQLMARYVNGRVDIERKAGSYRTLDVGKLATEAARAVSQAPLLYCGKTFLPPLRAAFYTRFGNKAVLYTESRHLSDDDLVGISKKTFRVERSA